MTKPSDDHPTLPMGALDPFSLLDADTMHPQGMFMTNINGEKVGTAFSTPRSCIMCGIEFIPPKTGYRRISEVCRQPDCKKRRASRGITAVGQEAAILSYRTPEVREFKPPPAAALKIARPQQTLKRDSKGRFIR